MKTEGMTTFLPTDKEEMKRLIAEVKEIVSTIIHLPAEKEVMLGTVALRNSRKNNK
jgi:hypothetical protein